MNRRSFLAWSRHTVTAAVVADPWRTTLHAQDRGSGFLAPIVETAYGKVRGARVDGVAAFKGVR